MALLLLGLGLDLGKRELGDTRQVVRRQAERQQPGRSI
jgi:hypothetical protein